ncbi:MAG: RNA polymerase sigma-54 factor [Desulfobacteraceae bacterium]|nr:MAG: RNA polymerase sigma-54 factor [Desulfobacteraceae bacterium]
MAIELQQHLRLQQSLVMTPQLQMAIKLLQLSRLELVEMIQQEMETNPTLEETVETYNEDSMEESPGETIAIEAKEPDQLKEVSMDEKFDSYLDWNSDADDFSGTGKMQFEGERKESTDFEAFTTNKTSLADHLRWQLLMTRPSPEDEELGSLIIGNIDKDGYLDISVEEIAQTTNSSPEKISRILALMKTFDPPGVFASDLKECLLLQARHLGVDDPLIIDMIRYHLKDLETKRYKAIAKALKTDLDHVIAAVSFIRSLDPKPGDKFNDAQQIYIVPDVYVFKEGDDYLILLNDDDIPRLHINAYYKKAVRRGEKIADETKTYLKDRLRSAEWLIKSIHHRRKTIYNVMESIVKAQRDFFDHGISHLKPMVLRDIADDIEMHESTVSRVTNNKYAHTPQGIFELKFFFNSSINRSNGDTIASASVQEKIRKIIENEPPKKPLSDLKLVEILEAADIHIARRTVAKYREMMGILPSSKRKQF